MGEPGQVNDQNGKFSGSWKTIAIISSVLSLGLVGALVTIAYVGGADALSTIALTLAVIAFIAQLVIFTIQTTHSAAQLREAQELNRATLEALGDTRSRIDTTYQMVSSHNEMLLRINSAKAREPHDVQVQKSSTSIALTSTSAGSASEPDVEVYRINPIVEIASSWPNVEQAEDALVVLESLSETSVRIFSLNLVSHLVSIQAGLEDDIGFSESDVPLVEKGLVRKVEINGQAPVARVTEHGRSIGRIIAAGWPPPSELEPVRKRLLHVREQTSPGAIPGFSVLSGYRR